MEKRGVFMTKKVLAVLLVCVISISAVFASDWHFVFGDVSQHPEVLWGFIPSYFDAGAGYKGLSLIDGNTTDMQLLVGGGISQRKLWQDPTTGKIIRKDPLIYDVWDFDWSVRFVQGFLTNPMNTEKDMISITLAYNGQYEKAKDSMAVGKERTNGEKRAVLSMEDFFSSSDRVTNRIYPEINGSGDFLGTQLASYIKFDLMEDTLHENNGFLGKVSMLWGPLALNGSLSGFADYFALRMDAIGAYTLYDYKKNDKSYFSVVIADRLNCGYVTGNAIPAFIQGPESLGRKVRGFNTYTYNTSFTVVNNLDLRLCGPDMGLEGLAPRVNLFFDIGYGCGNVNNTEDKESNLLASTGVQGTVSIFDFIDLGYQLAYLIKGDNYTNGSSRIAGSVTFFLDF